MRKFYAVLAVLAFVFAFAFGAQAQTMTTDIVFLKVGYIPVSTTSFEDTSFIQDDLEARGLAVQGEYNLNFDRIWLGFGLEYQRLKAEIDGENGHFNQFLLPMVSVKFAAAGGLYVGAGLSGKYLIATEKIKDGGNEYEWEKDIDLWANGILGYYMPIGEGIFLDLEGRFGYNLTNNQFSEMKVNGVKGDTDNKSSFDLAFYVGIGYRASMSDY